MTSSLLFEVRDILRDLPPDVWDTRGWDALLLYKVRYSVEETNSELLEIFKQGIAEEASVNTSRYKQYKNSGGKYTVTPSADGSDPLIEDTETTQAAGFVTSGRLVGDQIILQTVYGTVNTATDRILTFRLFQQDVLRATGKLYESVNKKHHEPNVKVWLELLTKVEKTEDDDTLPVNILRDYMEEFLIYAEVEPDRFESSIRNKLKPILKEGKEYQFSPDNLMAWLKMVDKERKWTKAQAKIYLQTIYGERYSSDKRAFNCRIFAIMSQRPDVPATASLVSSAAGTSTPHPAEVQHDSGRGKDDATHQRHAGTAETGSESTGNLDPIVLESHSPGSEGTPTSSPDIPF